MDKGKEVIVTEDEPITSDIIHDIVDIHSVEDLGTDATMQAAIYSEYGGPSVVSITSDQPIPKVGNKDILVRVVASAVNPIDWKLMKGILSKVAKFTGFSFPFIPGFDFSGIVVRVGKSCKRLSVGDQVFGMASFKRCGAFAEYISIEETLVELKPDNMSFMEAAAIPLVGQTSYQSLIKHAKLKSEEKVLILGGSGGTGSLAIQIAKAYDCKEIATTCSAKNEDFVRKLGATVVIDYNEQNWWDVLEGKEYDVVYDCVGGENNWPYALRVLKNGKNGRFVSIASDPSKPTTPISIGSLISSGVVSLNRNFWHHMSGQPSFSTVRCSPTHDDLNVLKDLIENNQLKVFIDHTFNLKDIREALEYSIEGHTKGKIIITCIPKEKLME